MTQFGYVSFLSLVCIVKHSGVPLPALDSTQIKNLIWLSRTLANVMGDYFANEIVHTAKTKLLFQLSIWLPQLRDYPYCANSMNAVLEKDSCSGS